jgi:glycosyltransferase involved in cell wall biosynthesis
MGCQPVDLSVLHLGAGRYIPGDTTHSTFMIWRELARGFTRYTVVGRSSTNSFSRIEYENLTVHLLPSYTSSEAEFLFAQAAAIRIGLDVKCQVVIAQCPVKGGLAGCALTRMVGARLLTELHGNQYYNETSTTTFHAAIRSMARYPLRRSHRIRALSEGMKYKLMERYGSDLEQKIVCLPPRVDLNIFHTVKHDWSLHDPPRLIMVGSVNENKGQLRFLSGLIRAKLKVELWIAGDGPDVEPIRELASNLKGSVKVRFIGRVCHESLSNILPQADIFVMFSRSEGMPRSIIEAMAAGLPIITTNAGFCAEVVCNGVEGFVLEDDSETEFFACLSYLLNSHKTRAQMGSSARVRAISEYDSEKLYTRYRSLICETALS